MRKLDYIILVTVIILSSCATTYKSQHSVTGVESETALFSCDYRSKLSDTTFWIWERPDAPAFEIHLPVPDSDTERKIMWYPTRNNGDEYYFFYPDGEVVFLHINRIVSNISLVELNGYILSHHITRKSHGYYYNGPFDEVFVEDYDYLVEYNGQPEVVNRYLNDEERNSVWTTIEFDIGVAIKYEGYSLNKEEYSLLENRKTFYFIKDDIMVMLYNIKPENFLRYYNVLSKSLKVFEIDGAKFALPTKSSCRGWKSIRVGD